MNRRNFISTMLASGSLVSLPPLQWLNKEDQDKYAWTDHSIEVFFFDSFVAGFSYYEGPKVIQEIKEHDPLELVREYDNPYDEYAVAIYWEGKKIGFLPAKQNMALANLLDQGMLLSAYVLFTQPDKVPWAACFVGVNLVVPYSKDFEAYLINRNQDPRVANPQPTQLEDFSKEIREEWEDYPSPPEVQV